jgi:hypothetical protein
MKNTEDIDRTMFATATEDGLVAIKIPDEEITYFTPDEAIQFSHQYRPWFRAEIKEAVNESRKKL